MTELMKQAGARPAPRADKRQKAAAWGLSAAILMAAFSSLTACSTLTDAYRDISGKSKQDPPPDAPNTAALDQGGKQDYPNLASVPDTPTRGLTQTQRDQLAQGLIADRNNAHYTADRLAVGDNAAVMPSPSALPEDQTATSGALPDSAAPPPPESKTLPDGAVAPASEAPTVPASSADTQLAGPDAALPPAAASSSSVSSGANDLAGPDDHPGAAAVSPKSKRRRQRLAQQDAAKNAPVPRENPAPQAPEEPPAAPALAPTPAAPSGNGSELASGGVLTDGTQVASAPVPGEVPAAPTLSQSPSQPESLASNTGTKRANSKRYEVDFASGSSEVPASAAPSLAPVPALHAQYGGLIRVVSHAEIPTGGSDPAGAALTSYQSALARSQAVKQTLIDKGIPAAQIISEVSTKEPPSDRVDVIVEY